MAQRVHRTMGARDLEEVCDSTAGEQHHLRAGSGVHQYRKKRVDAEPDQDFLRRGKGEEGRGGGHCQHPL
eukprot:2436561-Rhodomonas_salina.3